MHKWTKDENTICILCYKMYKHLPVTKQKEIINKLLPYISLNSISFKLGNILYLEDQTKGFKNGSKVLREQWALIR